MSNGYYFFHLKKKKRPGKVEWIIQRYSEINDSIDVSTSFLRKKAVFQIVFIVCIVLLLGLIYLKQLSYVMRLCVFHKSLLNSKKENVLKLQKIDIHNELISKGKVYTVPQHNECAICNNLVLTNFKCIILLIFSSYL